MTLEAAIDRENKRCTHEWAAFVERHPINYTKMSGRAQSEADALAEKQGARLAAILGAP